MTYEEILEHLGYATGHDLQVRITLQDGGEIVGIPTSVDIHPTAHEVYIQPLGVEDTEIGVGLGQIRRVDLL
jgi:hypothetical protein